MQSKDKLLDKLLAVQWIFENIFWKFVDQIVYNQRKEKLKNILYNVYGYHDTYSIFRPEVDENKTHSILKTMFTYYDPPQVVDDEKKIYFKKE